MTSPLPPSGTGGLVLVAIGTGAEVVPIGLFGSAMSPPPSKVASVFGGRSGGGGAVTYTGAAVVMTGGMARAEPSPASSGGGPVTYTGSAVVTAVVAGGATSNSRVGAVM